MRGLIFVVAVMLAGAAHAGGGDYAVPSIQAVTSTITVSAISIATFTATDVIISTNPLYRQVCVQNIDKNSFLACSESINVSTDSARPNFGVDIATAAASGPAIPFCFEVVPGSRFYCYSSSQSASTRAVIIRKR